MSNNKQQECQKCLQGTIVNAAIPYVGGHSSKDCSCECHTPQQDTGWEERVANELTEIAEGWGNPQSVIDLVTKEKHLSEQQGYQKAVQEVLEVIEQYFKGLIDIPFPQKTKEKLREQLQRMKGEK